MACLTPGLLCSVGRVVPSFLAGSLSHALQYADALPARFLTCPAREATAAHSRPSSHSSSRSRSPLRPRPVWTGSSVVIIMHQGGNISVSNECINMQCSVLGGLMCIMYSCIVAV